MRARFVRCGRCGRRNRVPAVGRGLPRCGNCRNPLPWVADAGDGDFTEIAERATLPVLVHMWAPWCAPCLAAAPGLELLACHLAGHVKVVTVNVGEAPKLRQRFVVESVPTLMVLRGPQIVAYQGGAPPEPSLRAWLEPALGRAAALSPSRQLGLRSPRAAGGMATVPL